jgi:hypothetical protein
MISWNETNTEAFAGLYNAGYRILLVFHEASAIPDQVPRAVRVRARARRTGHRESLDSQCGTNRRRK